MGWRRTVSICALWATLTVLLRGAAAREVAVPDDLEPWIPWVLDTLKERDCPVVDEQAVCFWPGILEINVSEQRATFRQSVRTDRAGLFPLPGSAEHWPQSVQVTGKPVVVLEQSERPFVALERGKFAIEGEFVWEQVPEVLQVPGLVAAIALKVDGQDVAFPERDADSRIWLKAVTRAADEPERLELEVFRRIDDRVPMWVTTRLLIRASGKAREVNLGRVLLDGTKPVKLSSALPARLERNGDLVVQLRAGSHDVTLEARTVKDVSTLQAPKRGPPWPEHEVWVWAPDDSLRQVEVHGGRPTDPARTNLPDEWRALSAYAVDGGQSLKFNTLRRGQTKPPPNQISLNRSIWLDLDGEGLTVQDRLTGSLHNDWRLDLLEGNLGRVAVGGTDQLITKRPGGKHPGVELRNGNLDLTADWRAQDFSGDVPAVGWSDDVQSLSTSVHLPPGWELVATSGVDDVDGTWISDWDLFAVFFVLLIALATAKLVTPLFGLVALVTLVLTHGRPDEPYWVWAFLLAFLAVLRVLPQGWLRDGIRIGWWAMVCALAIIVLMFSTEQIKTGLFPHTRSDTDYPGLLDGEGKFDIAPAAAPEPEMLEELAAEAPAETMAPTPENKPRQAAKRRPLERLAGKAKSGESLSYGGSWREEPLLKQDPKAVIQTGPGVPNWSWHTWQLDWDGPVDRTHRLKLLLISPALGTVFAFLRVALVALLALALLRSTPYGPTPGGATPKRSKGKKSSESGSHATEPDGVSARVATRALISSAAFLLIGLLAIPARAQMPSQELLDQLKTRLTASPDCAEECLSVSKIDVKVKDSSLTLQAEVHAGKTTTFVVPGPAKNWVPESVEVDGKPTPGLALISDFLHVRLETGRHVVTLAGPIAHDELTLTLGAPHRVQVAAPGWEVDGVREDGRVEGSIQLRRELSSEPGTPSGESGNSVDLPPWLEITRTLNIGVNWTIDTQVRRVSPEGSPVVIRFPLLPTEQVTQSDVVVEDNHALISLSRDQVALEWKSTLGVAEKVSLNAAKDQPWTEVWVINCGPVFSCKAEGLEPVLQEAGDRYQPRFQPWPGEKLTVNFSRPLAVEGISTTVDGAWYTVVPGLRLSKATLELQLRSSRGGTRVLTLPAEAKLQSLKLDGIERPATLSSGKLSVSVKPGRQNIEVAWQQPGGIEFNYAVPTVHLGGSAVNVRTTVKLPDERWLLALSGPSWGPVILFWAYLVLIVLAALALSRVPRSPLRFWQWGLLGLGLTQVPAPVALLIAGWFFIVEIRSRRQFAHPVLYNFGQLALAGSTVVFLGLLVAAIYTSLMDRPDMLVAGNGSSSRTLQWYLDRVDGATPDAKVISASLWAWRGAMLLWALWLASALIGWLKWAWSSFGQGGLYKRLPRLQKPVAAAAGASAATPEAGGEIEPAPGGADASREDNT